MQGTLLIYHIYLLPTSRVQSTLSDLHVEYELSPGMNGSQRAFEVKVDLKKQRMGKLQFSLRHLLKRETHTQERERKAYKRDRNIQEREKHKREK